MKEKLFFLFYLAVTSILNLILFPYLLYLSRKKEKYRHSIPARFFLRNNRPLKPNGIWFHLCSYGEAKSIKPILDKLSHDSIRLTAITQTGYDELHRVAPHQCRYLPFEPWLLSWIRPQYLLVVMEAELWYMLFALSKKRGARTMLVNARVSDASWIRYRRFGWLYRRIFAYIDEVYAQTELDRERLAELGAKNISVTGNIKLANIPKPKTSLQKPAGLIVTAASTHHGEERIVLDAFKELLKNEPSVKLIVVPRHPERFDEVSRLCSMSAKELGVSYGLYSECRSFDSAITVVDEIGMLVDIYAISDIVVLGGAFGRYGGHNAAEAAQFGCRIISGEHYHNQKDIFDAIEGIAIADKKTLSNLLLGYRDIEPAKIVHKTDLEPILNSIQETIRKREDATSI